MGRWLSMLGAFSVAAMGCDVVTGPNTDLVPCTRAAPLEGANALSMNSLSENALSMNALSMNALSMNGLGETDLLDSADGRELVRYLVHCALPADVTLSNRDVNSCDEDAPGTFTFSGGLGLAPEWLEEGLGGPAQERVSACLMSHVNYFGASVTISVRHPSLEVSSEELEAFPTYEGAFFGNLFSEDQPVFVCSGKPGPQFNNVEYPNHDKSQGDRLIRRCTDRKSALTMCDFEYVGTCQSVCRTISDGLVTDCYERPNKKGKVYSEAITTWLLAPDDTRSIWPEAYHTYYGP